MHLNSLKPAPGAKKNRYRVGRGIGSGNGKTAGRGHKGQTARSGYSQKIGFEGGQMPLQRRTPKFGFTPLARNAVAEVRLGELTCLTEARIDLEVLKHAKIINALATKAKIILSGKIDKPVTISGIAVTRGARQAILAVGGKVEE